MRVSHTVNGIKLRPGQSEDILLDIATRRLKKAPAFFRILKKSLDARDKGDINWVYSIEFSDCPPPAAAPLPVVPQKKLPASPVVVVGSGPCGLFAAIRLLDRGIKPIVAERGDNIEVREQKTAAFAKDKIFDAECNIQFGEGGAGTFSDGKLNTQTHSRYNREVADIFVRFGAPEEIRYLSKPHIGSDNLKKIIVAMRRYIESAGGKILFGTRMDDIVIKDGKAESVVFTRGGKTDVVSPRFIVMAVGHSARDTFEMLLRRGVSMRAKDFAVGFRIEHLQKKISFAQYGEQYKLLPPADYKLVSHTAAGDAFTFCMCPGGYVVAAAGERGGVVTNGMSNYARDAENANSALITPVGRALFGDHPLAGVYFQRRMEREAFSRTGSYNAPVQRLEDFLAGRKSTFFGEVKPTYPGAALAECKGILPAAAEETLKAAVTDMDRRLKGFASPDAVITFPESRTSSPVRIERDSRCRSISADNLYPAGEGAGYSGGITSSAADGLRVADAIVERLLNGED